MYSAGQPEENPAALEAAEEAAKHFNRSDPLLYEPRALWEVVSVDSAEPDFSRGQNAQALQAQITLRGREWRNASRYPVTLTHLLMCGVGYTMREQTATPVDLTTYHNSMAVLPTIGVRVSAPFRKHFTRMPYIDTWGWVPEPAGEPTTRYSDVATASGLFGISRWDFDKPYWIPRKGTLHFELGTIGEPDLAYVNAPSSGNRDPVAFVNFEQQYPAGGVYRMSSRMVEGTVQFGAALGEWPSGPITTPADAFGNRVVAQSTLQAWPGAISTLTNNEWDKQEANRGSDRSWLTGFNTFIDQILYDDSITGAADAGANGQRVAPISTRMGTRCKTTNGGSNQEWWRPGCPLALVSPTITPATVHRLEKPIVLAPGDQLEVQLLVPNPQAIAGASPPTLSPTYNFGISMTGYAEIQG